MPLIRKQCKGCACLTASACFHQFHHVRSLDYVLFNTIQMGPSTRQPTSQRSIQIKIEINTQQTAHRALCVCRMRVCVRVRDRRALGHHSAYLFTQRNSIWTIFSVNIELEIQYRHVFGCSRRRAVCDVVRVCISPSSISVICRTALCVCAHRSCQTHLSSLPQAAASFFFFSFFWCQDERISVSSSHNNGVSGLRLSVSPIYFTQCHGIMNSLCRHQGKVHLKPSHSHFSPISFDGQMYFSCIRTHTHSLGE